MKQSQEKIADAGVLSGWTVLWKNAGKKIVFTNGCFDVLHLGHIDYLERARRYGDILVVALNSDQSVKQLKGPMRPVNDEQVRARMVAALECVDAVVIFQDPTPERLISVLLPDVLVKGADYLPENIAGANIVKASGGEVKTVELVPGFSTTAMIEKIKRT